MRIKTITNGSLSITLSEATIEHEIRRVYMADDGIKSEEPDPILRMMRTFTWPTFTACVVSATGVELPITFEAFRAMPGGLLNEWADAVYELNPAWNPSRADPKSDDDPKESTNSAAA